MRANTMSDDLWVKQATRAARIALLLSLAFTVLLVGVLLAERSWQLSSRSASLQNLQQARALAATILLEDERLTMSANMAAATGDAQWAARYTEHLPLIDDAIAKATRLAPPGAKERFDQATRLANDRLVALETRALAHARDRELAQGQTILASSAYASDKAVLARGTTALLAELQAHCEAQCQTIEQQSWTWVGFILLLAAVGFALLWRRLQTRLVRAELAFADKQAQVTQLALHDTLTELPNRRYLNLQLAGAIARASREQREFALLVIDLDGFKPVNDQYGHSAGDAVLTEISRRLTVLVRHGEMAARLGGDEFAVMLNHGVQSDGALGAAQRLMLALSEPVALPQGLMRVGASVGVALFPADATTADDLLRKADVAMYRAKQDGGRRVHFFAQFMDEELRDRAAFESHVRDAVALGQIVPHFQPLIELSSGRLTGFEALARWDHATRGAVPPDEFIPVADRCGVIDTLTTHIMTTSLAAAAHWPAPLRLAVNFAPSLLKRESLPEEIMQLLREANFPPERFEIEITESALIDDRDVAKNVILRIKSYGIRVALDDFGTGYSSLSHLSDLPFDRIKIDRSFVQTMQTHPESATIVSAIIALGRSLNRATTAEGIETPADAAALQAMGCEAGQGFLYSRAIASEEVAALITRLGVHTSAL